MGVRQAGHLSHCVWVNCAADTLIMFFDGGVGGRKIMGLPIEAEAGQGM